MLFFLWFFISFLLFPARCNSECKSLPNLEAVMINDERPEVMATEAGKRRFEYSEKFRTSFFKSISSTLVAPEIVKWPTIITRECPNSPSHMQNDKYRGERGTLLAHIQVLDYFQRRHSHCAHRQHLHQHALIIFDNDAFAAVPDAAEMTLLFARNMTTDVLYLGFCREMPSCLHAYVVTVKGAKTLSHLLDSCGQGLGVQIPNLAEQGNITMRAIDSKFDEEGVKSKLQKHGYAMNGPMQYLGLFVQIHFSNESENNNGTLPLPMSSHFSVQDNINIYKESIALRQKSLQDMYGGDFHKMLPWEGQKGGWYLWDFFSPAFNCPLRQRFGKLSDGGKVLCNLGAVAHDEGCVMFSFGVFNDVSFEIEVMKRTKCTIYAHDPSVDTLPNGAMQMPPKECAARRAGGTITFEKVGLGSTNEVNQTGTGYNLKILSTLMAEKNVSVIDILKVDIEGAEWSVFSQLATTGVLEKVNQLSIELHFKQQTTNRSGKNSGVREVFEFFHDVENAGLYAFSNEVNFGPAGYNGQKDWAIEYTFVRPTSKFITEQPTLNYATFPCSSTNVTKY